MRSNNCNLKLQLQPPCNENEPVQRQSSSNGPLVQQLTQKQKLTIFYDGQVCVCNVTEFQARAILLRANREKEMEEQRKSSSHSGRGEGESNIEEGYSTSSTNQSNVVESLAPALSMKRSLQRFLQKRKHRSLATSPYYR